VVVSYASDELTILVLLVSSSSVEEKIYWHQKCLLVIAVVFGLAASDRLFL
jgi:hypothetical protein